MALRKEGSGVVLGCQLPHLIGIDEDLLSTGIVLYYLKVKRLFEHHKIHTFVREYYQLRSNAFVNWQTTAFISTFFLICAVEWQNRDWE